MNRLTTIVFLCFILLLATRDSRAAADNWPGFRGPTGLGYTSDTALPVEWGEPDGKNVLWKSPLVGEGHASPIVWGDSVFICTARWPQGAQRDKVIPEQHVTCYRTADGRELWDTLVPPGPWLRTDFRSGPGGGYAAATPCSDGKLVYCVFGSSVIAALDFQGRIAWRKQIVPYTFDVTVGSSPILYRDTVILQCAMARAEDSRVIAFDKSSGQIKWQHKLESTAFGHSTPVVVDVNRQPQMLVVASGMKVAPAALQALDPSDGHRLWWCRGAGDAASVAAGDGIVYFDSGRGSLGVAVDPTGSGDVSDSRVRWTIGHVPEGIGSPIVVGHYVYRLHSPEILRCWDARTGKLVYAKRLEGIGSTWASPVADAAGHLFFATAGKSYVLQAGPEFRVLAVNDLDDANHPSPAVCGGRIFLEGKNHLWCVGARK